MTRQKTFKRRVRERMERTGESYVSARAALIGEEPAGAHRETSALQFALADAGIEISEPLLLIIAAAPAPRACRFATRPRTSRTSICPAGTRSRATSSRRWSG